MYSYVALFLIAAVASGSCIADKQDKNSSNDAVVGQSYGGGGSSYGSAPAPAPAQSYGGSSSSYGSAPAPAPAPAQSYGSSSSSYGSAPAPAQSYGGGSSSGPAQSIPAPPCPRNYLFSCQPSLAPVPCASSSSSNGGYGSMSGGSAGAYSQYVPSYVLPPVGYKFD